MPNLWATSARPCKRICAMRPAFSAGASRLPAARCAWACLAPASRASPTLSRLLPAMRTRCFWPIFAVRPSTSSRISTPRAARNPRGWLRVLPPLRPRVLPRPTPSACVCFQKLTWPACSPIRTMRTATTRTPPMPRPSPRSWRASRAAPSLLPYLAA